MTGDKEDQAVLRAIAADNGLPFVPTRWDELIERLDYIALLLEELCEAVNPAPVQWEQEDDGETMSA